MMNTILDHITRFNADQFTALVNEHSSILRTNPAEYTDARNTVTRLPGFGALATDVTALVNERMEMVGFFGGREKAIAAARNAAAAHEFRDQLTGTQFAALTATFDTVAAVPA